MPFLILLHISKHDVAEGLKQELKQTYFLPLTHRRGVPPIAIEKDVRQDCVVSNARIRQITCLCRSGEAMRK